MEKAFNGVAYEAEYDFERLTSQIARIFRLMRDGRWRTLREISVAVHAPEASVSAQLRALRRKKYGAHVVRRRRRGNPKAGLFEYQLVVKQHGL